MRFCLASGKTVLVQTATFVLFLNLLVSQTVFSMNKDEARKLAEQMEQTYRTATAGSETLSENTTLEGYLGFALMHNPELKAAFHRWQQKLERVTVESGLPDPVFSYGYFIENVETRVGPQEQRFSLKQTIPWFGSLGARGDVAFAQAQAAYEEFRKAELSILYQVKAAYYDYYLLEQRISITRDDFELLGFWESVARRRYAASLESHPDLIKAQVEQGLLENQLTSLEQMRVPIMSRLRALLNLPDSAVIPAPIEPPREGTDVERSSLLSTVRQQSPDLKRVERLIEQNEASFDLAGKMSMPNFTLAVDYIKTGEAINPATTGSGKDPWMVSVGVNLPIWFGKNSARQESARAGVYAAQSEHRALENKLAERLDQILFAYNDARRQAALYRDGLIPKGEQALNVAYTAYQAGETSFLNLLDAQRRLLEFRLAYETGLATQATRFAELELLAGGNITSNN